MDYDVWFRTVESSGDGGYWPAEHNRWQEALAYAVECCNRLRAEGWWLHCFIEAPMAGDVWRAWMATKDGQPARTVSIRRYEASVG
jgi:hypothetical protein